MNGQLESGGLGVGCWTWGSCCIKSIHKGPGALYASTERNTSDRQCGTLFMPVHRGSSIRDSTRAENQQPRLPACTLKSTAKRPEGVSSYPPATPQDYAESLNHVHFRAEGDVEFRSILYIPSVSPYDFYDKYYEKAQNGLKLYVRRVFISDDMKELIPRWVWW